MYHCLVSTAACVAQIIKIYVTTLLLQVLLFPRIAQIKKLIGRIYTQLYAVRSLNIVAVTPVDYFFSTSTSLNALAFLLFLA